jgi:tRNA A37 threonylcarbamoyladenosine biosynthesis protein TsaE
MLNFIPATKVGKLLRNAGVRVVILNACNSAVADSGIAANLALELLRCGISTAIAMSYKVLLRAADIFMRHFYESLLVKGNDMLTSAWQARCALRENRSRQSLFGLNVDVDDSIVPVFYTRHALVENATSNLGLDLGGLPKIPPSQWNSGQSSNGIGDTTLVGRDLDTLELESRLIHKGGFIILYGTIGIGKTALLDDMVSWWQTTKYVRSYMTFNMSEFSNLPLEIILDRIRGKVKQLSDTIQHNNPELSVIEDEDEDEDRAPIATVDNVLLIIDQAEDYLRAVESENRVRFWEMLSRFHDDINQLYPFLMIVSSSYNEPRHSK